MYLHFYVNNCIQLNVANQDLSQINVFVEIKNCLFLDLFFAVRIFIGDYKCLIHSYLYSRNYFYGAGKIQILPFIVLYILDSTET